MADDGKQRLRCGFLWWNAVDGVTAASLSETSERLDGVWGSRGVSADEATVSKCTCVLKARNPIFQARAERSVHDCMITSGMYTTLSPRTTLVGARPYAPLFGGILC